MLSRLDPCVVRVYDEPSTKSRIKRILNIDVEGAYVVLGFDGYSDIVELQEKKAFEICDRQGAQVLGREHGQKWWDHRYDFYFPPDALDFPMDVRHHGYHGHVRQN